MKIDFYVFNDLTSLQAWHYICKLIDKYYLAQQSLFIQAANPNDANYLDQLLWTFEDTHFIPHHLDHEQEAFSCLTPIHISEMPPPPSYSGVIMNMNLNFTLADQHHFQSLIEIVFKNEAIAKAARTRYKQYQIAKHELTTYKITASDL